jgi:hypothetical protein
MKDNVYLVYTELRYQDGIKPTFRCAYEHKLVKLILYLILATLLRALLSLN